MKDKIASILLSLCVLLLTQYKFLLSAYARFFVIDNPTVGTDAAIVVLTGSASTRISKALELYKEGYGTRILLTTPRYMNSKVSRIFPSYEQQANLIAEMFNISARFEQVSSLKEGATSTFDEAYDLLAFCLKKQLKHLILVTDAFHTRRALYTFKKVFDGRDIKIEVSAANNDIFNTENWWHSDKGITAYILEPIKFFVYLFTDKNVSFIQND